MKNFIREFDESLAQYLPEGTRWLLYFHLIGVIALKSLLLIGGAVPLVGDIAERLLVLTPNQAILQGHIWQFFVYQFTYNLTFFEIIFAAIYLLVLLSFAAMFESNYSARQLWTFIILTGLVGGVLFCALALGTGMGAATAYGSLATLLAMLMLMTLHYPRMEVRLFFVIPIQIRFVTAIVVLLILLDLGGAISQQGAAGALRHALSLGGLATAVLVWKKPSLLDLGDRLPFRRRKAKVVRMQMGHPGRHSDPDDRYNDPHWRLDQ